MKKWVKAVASILICSIFVSCSASTHPGVFTVEEPTTSEQDVHKWFLFYQDQFDARNGEVARPSVGYPLQAIEGYDKAEKDWKEKVYKNSQYDIVGAVIVVGFVIYILTDPKATRGGGTPGFSWR